MISFAYIQASHLLKYDSMLGTFKADVKAFDNETISVDGKLIKVVSNRDPLKLPWAELGIDIVIEVCIYILPLSPLLSPLLSLMLFAGRGLVYLWMDQEQGSTSKQEQRR